jgi:uncharacterized membrane protein YeaQ/YmgE (transglycosylase-associated protein family)
MTVGYVVWFLVIGVIAGWLAGMIMKGRGFGLVGNMIVGVLGAVIGGWVFGAIGLVAYGTLGSLIMALIGAVVLLGLISLIKRA